MTSRPSFYPAQNKADVVISRTATSNGRVQAAATTFALSVAIFDNLLPVALVLCSLPTTTVPGPSPPSPPSPPPPSSLSEQTELMYLPRGMTGRIDCPFEDDPPLTIIMWIKDDVALDLSTTRNRVRTTRHGSLVIRSVTSSDEGRYSCIPYSPQTSGPTSPPVQVLVRGQ